MVERRRLFISCEHGGNRVPEAYRELFRGQEQPLASHRGYDPGALGLARRLAKDLHAPSETAEITRLLIDLNRSQASTVLFSAVSRGLSRAEKEQLLGCYYHPYRNAVRRRIAALIADGAQVVHLSVHSFTPVLDAKVRFVDLGLLYDPARKQEKRFCQHWQQNLRERRPEWRVRCNAPYRGRSDGLVRTLRGHFEPQDYLGLELEVNQALLEGRKNFPGQVQNILLESLRDQFVAD